MSAQLSAFQEIHDYTKRRHGIKRYAKAYHFLGHIMLHGILGAKQTHDLCISACLSILHEANTDAYI